MTTVIGVLLLSAVLVFFTPGMGWDRSSLVFVDVGQGDCLHIRTPGGKNILIDAGGSVNYNLGKKTLLPYLLKNGVSRIDLAIVTHLHSDHFKGLTELCQEMPVDRLAVSECNNLRKNELTSQTGLSEEQLIFLYAGETVRLEKDVFAEILYPERDSPGKYEELLNEEDENKSSLIIKLVYKGVSVLMTGDLGFEGEQELLRLYERANGRPSSNVLKNDRLSVGLLKVGHHGSRYSTSDDFLEAVSPSAAIIQVGRNTFGHPSQEVIRKLEDSGALTFRNDESGAILIDINDDRSFRIKTVLD
jgi:competence protein ComEC